MSTMTINIGDALKAGFELYKQNFGILLLVNLIAAVIGSLTVGILTGPLMAGVVIVTLAVLDGQEPKAGDVFKGFEVFLPAFLYWLIMMVISMVAHMLLPGLSIIVSYVMAALTVFTIFFIVEARMDFWPAIVRSYNIVKDDFFAFFLLVLVAGLISSAGLLLCCIGVIFTMPLYYCILAVVYRKHFPLGAINDSNSVEVEVNKGEIVVEGEPKDEEPDEEPDKESDEETDEETEEKPAE